MIDGSEKRNGSLNFERQSPHVIERRSKSRVVLKLFEITWQTIISNSCTLLYK